MSSPGFPFPSWRRRAASINSQDVPEDGGAPIHSSPLIGPQLPTGDPRQLSSSFSSTGHREPIRSFIHGTNREHLIPVDSTQYARSVREDTAELASYLLSDRNTRQPPGFLARQRSVSSYAREPAGSDSEEPEAELTRTISHETEAIPEVSEPDSPDIESDEDILEGPSILTSLPKKSPPLSRRDTSETVRKHDASSQNMTRARSKEPGPTRRASQRSGGRGDDEATPLLGRPRSSSRTPNGFDIEGQTKRSSRNHIGDVSGLAHGIRIRAATYSKAALNPKHWNRHTIWRNAVVAPASCLPAVIVGLLLNILDALSYGMILFPLGKPIFENLGPAGISMFYVSTIISQLTFSFGSIFKGGIGSELIEVVPFFHNMAQTITDFIGEDKPDAVIATTIVSYALSSMMTGTVFYLMGKFKFGYMVGFIPRHILIGCIGGVGFFLVVTGFEVSARMDGSLEYDMNTLHKLFQADTAPLWVIPLALAIILFYCQSRSPGKYFLPLYILLIPIVFYFFVFALDSLNPDTLRDKGWIFEGPPAGEPWWYFYTLYKFHLVEWEAVMACIPAMLALTFFGILHVPINVPALALNTGEDNADLDRELKLHGYSNFLSGLAGSIQNYLVYANTVFFMRSGGDSRLAGIMLACLTFLVMTIGPKIIGFIPVMVVGTLIFDLGFELLLEAVWSPRKKLKVAEYLTVIVIVLVMGIYDFVIGIGVGILLAFVSLIIQTSRVTAVRAAYSGEIVTSTVRRNPSQHHYLKQVAKQIYIVKLTGYLFFGTIVSVEEKIRALIEDNAFTARPIKYLVIDMWQVTGLDYSAGEAFNTVSRLLNKKGIHLIMSGVDVQSQLGQNLRTVGIGANGIEVVLMPDLNSALESCENELLKTFYARQEALGGAIHAPTDSRDVPIKPAADTHLEMPANSPRRNLLHEAAHISLAQVEDQRPTRWQSFKEPLRLMLQVFQGLSEKNEDFWFRAVPYFARREYPQGSVLFKRDEQANGFYLIEKGMLRADYDLPQGWLAESIVAGTTCGELPFFSETLRTATVTVERDCVVWLMDKAGWDKLQKNEGDVAQEMLRISLKLTSERMSSITSYILTMAG